MPKASAALRAEQNEAFLAALGRAGNARLAARQLGVHRSTYTKRRARDPAFAARWDSRLAAVDSALKPADGAPSPPTFADLRTQGGELNVARLAGGRYQARPAPPRRGPLRGRPGPVRPDDPGRRAGLPRGAGGHRQRPARRRRRRLLPFGF